MLVEVSWNGFNVTHMKIVFGLQLQLQVEADQKIRRPPTKIL